MDHIKANREKYIKHFDENVESGMCVFVMNPKDAMMISKALEMVEIIREASGADSMSDKAERLKAWKLEFADWSITMSEEYDSKSWNN